MVPEATGSAPLSGSAVVTVAEAAEKAVTTASTLVAMTATRTFAPRSSVVSM